MTAYYNENDEFAAAWLRELIAQGHIAPGHVDTRSIEDVSPDDLRGFTQHHFFAGIGVWSHALRLAGWPDERPVWTGSCPCQPFSAAGKRGGAADKRHLWPAWGVLIRECRPPVVFGEQVEGAVRLGWLDLVFGDLEAEGYACGAAVFGAHSVGAPHIRQRLYWVADAVPARRPEGRTVSGDGQAAGGRADGWLADRIEPGLEGHTGDGDGAAGRKIETRSVAEGREPVGLADAHPPGCGVIGGGGLLDGERPALGDDADGRGADGWPTATAGFWRDPDWLACRDGRWRPVESGTFPLAHGVAGRMAVVRTVEQGGAKVQETHWYSRTGALRGFGNAIIAQQAAAFVRAYMTRP